MSLPSEFVPVLKKCKKKCIILRVKGRKNVKAQD